MFCRKCGQEIDDEAVVCIHCGCATKDVQPQPAQVVNPSHNEPKTILGVVSALFLGLIGLIIGICAYPEGTVARKTFIKAWVITWVVSLVICVVLYFIGVAALIEAAESMPTY